MIFESLMVLVGCSLLFWAGRRIWFARQSWQWPRADGVVKVSDVREHSDGEGGLYFAPHVEYSFKAMGRQISGTALNFGFVHERFTTRTEAQQRAAMFPEGAPVRVVHHPQRPNVCVLEPKLALGVYFVLTGGAVLATFGVWFLIEKLST